ncbi:MAG TPA: hypothetical protein VGO45_05900 [Bacteroidia bacterium]|jgi:hypothetical protein|nr:hypothetical protein [Bacteroidia bacterium]
MSQKITIRCGELVYEDSILYVSFNDGAEVDKADVEDIYSEGLKMSGGKPYMTLSDIRNNPASTPEARAFAATCDYAKYRLADALLADSSMTTLVANFYIRFNKPKVPTRLFSSKEKAVQWLQEIIKSKVLP